jgi:hypothetical protein
LRRPDRSGTLSFDTGNEIANQATLAAIGANDITIAGTSVTANNTVIAPVSETTDIGSKSVLFV